MTTTTRQKTTPRARKPRSKEAVSYLEFPTGIVLIGDCLDRLRDIDDCSIDSIVTDPPYEIGFMSRSWDSTGIAYSVELWSECLRVLKPGGHLLSFGATRSYHRMACAIEDAGFEIRDSIHYTYGSGFPKSHNPFKKLKEELCQNHESAPHAAVVSPFTQVKSSEVKEPTALALARTLYEDEPVLIIRTGAEEGSHELTAMSSSAWTEAATSLSIELSWSAICAALLTPENKSTTSTTTVVTTVWKTWKSWTSQSTHASTTPAPSSKTAGCQCRVCSVVSVSSDASSKSSVIRVPSVPASAIGLGAQWLSGVGTALKPSHEPIVVARKPLVGTVASNVLAHGTGALNIDWCRVGVTGGTARDGLATEPNEAGWANMKGHGIESLSAGRWPANTILTHAADCQQTGTQEDKFSVVSGMRDYDQDSNFGNRAQVFQEAASTQVPVWACVGHCPVYQLDQQSGQSKSGEASPAVLYGTHKDTGGNTVLGSGLASSTPNQPPKGDKGGASRFFTQTTWDPEWDHLLYVAKPSKAERNAGLDGLPKGPGPETQNHAFREKSGTRSSTARQNTHPTVKPVALMAHLIRLVTPPGGTVLDPFLGSGTTAVAAIREGFTWVGCEMTPDYLPIIEGRVTHAQSPPMKKAQKTPVKKEPVNKREKK